MLCDKSTTDEGHNPSENFHTREALKAPPSVPTVSSLIMIHARATHCEETPLSVQGLCIRQVALSSMVQFTASREPCCEAPKELRSNRTQTLVGIYYGTSCLRCSSKYLNPSGLTCWNTVYLLSPHCKNSADLGSMKQYTKVSLNDA